MKRRSRVEEESRGKGGRGEVGRGRGREGQNLTRKWKRTWESKEQRDKRQREKRKIKGYLSLEVSRVGNWLLDGTWSPGQVRHSDFRKKLKRENDHKVQKKKVENSKVAQTWAEGDTCSFYKLWNLDDEVKHNCQSRSQWGTCFLF